MDRVQTGTKCNVLGGGRDVPLGLAVDGVNRNHLKMVRETLASITVERLEPTLETPQELCLDTGYDDDEVRDVLDEFACTAHLRPRGEEAQALKQQVGFMAWRWIGRPHARWMNRFRCRFIPWNNQGGTRWGFCSWHVPRACISNLAY
jgi:hypothetical protein